MELRQLEYFVAIADTGSFTRAAESCHVAQSALSHQLARLESQLGRRLFERTSRSVVPTETGLTLLPFARRILGDLAEARRELDALEVGLRGHVRVGMTQTADRMFDLVSIAREYRLRFPDVELCVVSGPTRELVDEVASGRLDIAIAGEPGRHTPASVAYRPLVAREPLVAVVGADHPLARRGRTSLRELAVSGRFVEFRAESGLRDQVDSLFRSAGLPARDIAIEVGQIGDMVRFADSGLGAAIVPRVFTRGARVSCSASAPLDVLTISDREAFVSIGEYRHPQRCTLAMREFAELLGEQDTSVAS